MPFPYFGFGAGAVWGTPLTDAYGNTLTTPSPLILGTLQDVSVDFSGDVKELYGMSQMPVMTASGKMKITGKAKWATVNMANISSLFFGQSITSAGTSDYYDLVGSVVPATPYQVTVTPPNSGTWAAPLAVRDGAGNIYTKVASGATGYQYTVAAGVYTFPSAAAGLTIFIDYQYTTTSTTAKTSTIINVPMGTKPVFQLDLSIGAPNNPMQAMSMTLYQCVATKFSFATKLDDYMTQELDFSAFANSNGQVYKMGTGQ